MNNSKPEIISTERPLTEERAFASGAVKIVYKKTFTKTSARSIIFVHGNGEDSGIFTDIAERMAGEYTVYRPDSRGHGRSDKVKKLYYHDMAEDIANLIAHDGMEKPIVFGFSDGGIIGLLLAIKHPDLLGGLFVAGVNLTPDGIKAFWRRVMKLGYLLTKSDRLALMLTQPNIKQEDLTAIKTPTTVFYAEKDIVKITDSQTIIDSVKDSTLVIVPKENHASYVLDNEKLFCLLKRHMHK